MYAMEPNSLYTLCPKEIAQLAETTPAADFERRRFCCATQIQARHAETNAQRQQSLADYRRHQRDERRARQQQQQQRQRPLAQRSQLQLPDYGNVVVQPGRIRPQSSGRVRSGGSGGRWVPMLKMLLIQSALQHSILGYCG